MLTERIVYLSVVAALSVVLLAGCAPTIRTDGPQCHPFNYELTRAKDEPLANQTWPEVDALMEEHVARNDVAGCAVAAIKNGQLRYIGAYGLASAPPGDVGVKFDTVFPVGSVSKPITALALLTLVEAGHIDDLDDPIEKYLDFIPAVRPDWGAITLRQLLAHASGIDGTLFAGPINNANILSLAYGPFASIRPELTAAAMSVAGRDGTQRMPIPGTSSTGPFRIPQGLYSNAGYSLLGAVIDVVVQQAGIASGYEDYVYRYVALKNDNPFTSVAPITMCLHTYWDRDIEGLSSQARVIGNTLTFRPLSSTWGPEANRLWGWEGPSGGWSMTIADMARFGLLLAQDMRISAGLGAQMRETHVNFLPRTNTSYGLGTYTWGLLGAPAVGHGGTIGNFQTDVAVQLDGDVGLAMACNSGPATRTPASDASSVFGQVAIAIRDSAPQSSNASALSASASLWRDHAATLKLLGPAFRTASGDLDRAALARVARTMPEGVEVLTSFEANDLDAAANALKRILDDLLPDYRGGRSFAEEFPF